MDWCAPAPSFRWAVEPQPTQPGPLMATRQIRALEARSFKKFAMRPAAFGSRQLHSRSNSPGLPEMPSGAEHLTVLANPRCERPRIDSSALQVFSTLQSEWFLHSSFARNGASVASSAAEPILRPHRSLMKIYKRRIGVRVQDGTFREIKHGYSLLLLRDQRLSKKTVDFFLTLDLPAIDSHL